MRLLWSAQRLRAAPYRLCLAAAVVVWVASGLAWAAYLAALVHVDASMQEWPLAAHALVFALGAMPLFIAGFVFTAGPRWLRAPAMPATALVPSVALVASVAAAASASLVVHWRRHRAARAPMMSMLLRALS